MMNLAIKCLAYWRTIQRDICVTTCPRNSEQPGHPNIERPSRQPFAYPAGGSFGSWIPSARITFASTRSVAMNPT